MSKTRTAKKEKLQQKKKKDGPALCFCFQQETCCGIRKCPPWRKHTYNSMTGMPKRQQSLGCQQKRAFSHREGQAGETGRGKICRVSLLTVICHQLKSFLCSLHTDEASSEDCDLQESPGKNQWMCIRSCFFFLTLHFI